MSEIETFEYAQIHCPPLPPLPLLPLLLPHLQLQLGPRALRLVVVPLPSPSSSLDRKFFRTYDCSYDSHFINTTAAAAASISSGAGLENFIFRFTRRLVLSLYLLKGENFPPHQPEREF